MYLQMTKRIQLLASGGGIEGYLGWFRVIRVLFELHFRTFGVLRAPCTQRIVFLGLYRDSTLSYYFLVWWYNQRIDEAGFPEMLGMRKSTRFKTATFSFHSVTNIQKVQWLKTWYRNVYSNYVFSICDVTSLLRQVSTLNGLYLILWTMAAVWQESVAIWCWWKAAWFNVISNWAKKYT